MNYKKVFIVLGVVLVLVLAVVSAVAYYRYQVHCDEMGVIGSASGFIPIFTIGWG